MRFSWDDIRLFLDVARLGGLTPATRTTLLSAATLSRRIANLEDQLGKRLFIRTQSGYRLTPSGEELLERAEEVEAAALSIGRWKDGSAGERTVRVSAGQWTSAFLARHLDRIWATNDRFGLELVTANEKIDIGRRHADIGIRNQRPSESLLAGRLLGRVAYCLYGGSDLQGDLEVGAFVGVAGQGGQTHSARWLNSTYGDRILIRGNDAMSVMELVLAGVGLSVFPCFVGDSEPRLTRRTGLLSELATEQWLVFHHEERHVPAIRTVADRIATLMREEAPLFRGDRSSR